MFPPPRGTNSAQVRAQSSGRTSELFVWTQLGVVEIVCRLATSTPVVGQIYMRKIPRVTSTSCAESSGTVVAPGDHRTREHGAGRGTAQ